MTSDTRARVNARKAERNTKTPEPQKSAALPAKAKDTKRWCRGKVGREHDLRCFIVRVAGHDFGARERVCTRCGRKVDFFFPTFIRTEDARPVWVDK